MDTRNGHPVNCPIGGFTQIRHGGAARSMGTRVQETIGTRPKYNVRLPELDKVRPDGTTLQAIMGLVYMNAQ